MIICSLSNEKIVINRQMAVWFYIHVNIARLDRVGW